MFVCPHFYLAFERYPFSPVITEEFLDLYSGGWEQHVVEESLLWTLHLQHFPVNLIPILIDLLSDTAWRCLTYTNSVGVTITHFNFDDD